MPAGTDYTKCEGTDCSKRNTCYRFTMQAREKYQAWLLMKVAIPVVDECKFYLNNGEKD